MIPASIWLLLSHALLIAIGGGLLATGSDVFGLLFLLVLPGLRVARRFGDSGYRLMGYVGEPYGEQPTPGRRITRRSDPIRFRLMLLIELACILFMWGSVLLRLRYP